MKFHFNDLARALQALNPGRTTVENDLDQVAHMLAEAESGLDFFHIVIDHDKQVVSIPNDYKDQFPHHLETMDHYSQLVDEDSDADLNSTGNDYMNHLLTIGNLNDDELYNCYGSFVNEILYGLEWLVDHQD